MGRGKAKADGAAVDKADLIGELIAFSVRSYNPASPTRYGVTAIALVDLTVLTGAQSGVHVPRWRVHGAMARQIGELRRNVRHCARVTAGTAKNGHTWYGIDLEVDHAASALAAEYDLWSQLLDEMEGDE